VIWILLLIGICSLYIAGVNVKEKREYKALVEKNKRHQARYKHLSIVKKDKND
jgi:hypothetical protein